MSFIDRLRRVMGGRDTDGHAHGHVHEQGEGHDHDSVTCQEAAKLLYDYLDGELDEASEEHVRAHFEKCKTCYPHVRFEESFRSALRRAGQGEEAPAELKERLLGMLKDA